MPEKYRLIDLTGDGHGHHIPGTPIVYKHGWVPVKGGGSVQQTTAPKKGVSVTRSVTQSSSVTKVLTLRDKHGNLKTDATTIRHFRHITQQARLELFDEAGLTLKFRDKSEEDLLQMWHDPRLPMAEREAIRKEMDVRRKRLEIFATALDQSLLDHVHDQHRDWFTRWDESLKRIPGGRALIHLRQRLLSNKVFDHIGPVQEWLHEKGAGYAHHLLTAVAIGLMLHPLTSDLGNVLLGEAGQQVADHLMENLYVHSAIAVSLVKPIEAVVGPIFHPLSRKARVERAKKKSLNPSRAERAAAKRAAKAEAAKAKLRIKAEKEQAAKAFRGGV